MVVSLTQRHDGTKSRAKLFTLLRAFAPLCEPFWKPYSPSCEVGHQAGWPYFCKYENKSRSSCGFSCR